MYFLDGRVFGSLGTEFLIMFMENTIDPRAWANWDPRIYVVTEHVGPVEVNVTAPAYQGTPVAETIWLTRGEMKMVLFPDEIRHNGSAKATKAVLVQVGPVVCLRG